MSQWYRMMRHREQKWNNGKVQNTLGNPEFLTAQR
jgi:hypothetical protein